MGETRNTTSDQGAPPQLPPAVSPECRYRDVGDWLLLGCLGLTAFLALITLSSTAASYIKSFQYLNRFPDSSGITVIEMLLNVGLMTFSIYAGVRLWRIRPGAVKTASVYILCCLGYFLTSIVLTALSSEAEGPPTGTETMERVVFVALLCSYLASILSDHFKNLESTMKQLVRGWSSKVKQLVRRWGSKALSMSSLGRRRLWFHVGLGVVAVVVGLAVIRSHSVSFLHPWIIQVNRAELPYESGAGGLVRGPARILNEQLRVEEECRDCIVVAVTLRAPFDSNSLALMTLTDGSTQFQALGIQTGNGEAGSTPFGNFDKLRAGSELWKSRPNWWRFIVPNIYAHDEVVEETPNGVVNKRFLLVKTFEVLGNSKEGLLMRLHYTEGTEFFLVYRAPLGALTFSVSKCELLTPRAETTLVGCSHDLRSFPIH